MTGPAETADEKASRLHSALAIEELVAANHESNKTMVALVEHVRRETEARDRKIDVLEKNNRQTRWLTYLVGGAMVILLTLAIVNAVNISATQKQEEQVSKLNSLLLDCVNSTGECGKRNAILQNQLLDQVKQYNLVGFYCARTNPLSTDPKGEKFLECMQRLYPGGPTLQGR